MGMKVFLKDCGAKAYLNGATLTIKLGGHLSEINSTESVDHIHWFWEIYFVRVAIASFAELAATAHFT